MRVRRWYTLNLDQGCASQGGKLLSVKACESGWMERVQSAHTHTHSRLQTQAALVCMEETLGMFILIHRDSCGHLESAYVSTSLGLP